MTRMVTADAVHVLDVVAAHTRGADLAEVTTTAALRTRVDRKYVVAPQTFQEVIAAIADELAVVDIDGWRTFRYESVYFDTGDLASYHSAARSRRRRFKVRTRSYLDSGLCFVEIKRKSGRGETVKDRLPYSLEQRYSLDAEARRFVRGHLGLADDLRPTLATSYHRATFFDRQRGARITCDAGLVCTTPEGATVALPQAVLIETKSRGATTPVDRLLWNRGHRPVSLSKYCVGLACAHPWLPANKWNRTLRQHFGWDAHRDRN